MKKTLKREVAVALLLWLVYVVEVKDAQIIEVLVWPVFAFVTAAFGLDQYSKLQQNSQPTNRGRTSSSSQYPSRQNEYPKSWHVERHGRPEGHKPSSRHDPPDSK